jgi:hypothetical protein
VGKRANTRRGPVAKGDWRPVVWGQDLGWVLLGRGSVVGLVSSRHRAWVAYRHGVGSPEVGRGSTPEGEETGEGDKIALEKCLEDKGILFDLADVEVSDG